jgi:hypothetical protein
MASAVFQTQAVIASFLSPMLTRRSIRAALARQVSAATSRARFQRRGLPPA